MREDRYRRRRVELSPGFPEKRGEGSMKEVDGR